MKPDDPRFLRTVHDVRNLFKGKWAIAITVVLLDGPKHYKDILAGIRNLDVPVDWSDRYNLLHESVLTRTLKRMTADGLLIREEEQAAFPPSVRYSINGETRTALEAMELLADWGATHSNLIEQAKESRVRPSDQR